MKKDSVKIESLCIGIDLGDRHSRYAVLDRSTGEVVDEGELASTPRSFELRFGGLPRCRMALEVGGHSRWVSELLERLGHDVLVANPYKLRLISSNDRKSDRTDAVYLARLAAADPELLHPLKHRSRRSQACRCILIARDRLVGCRTKLINSIRGMVKATGARLPRSSSTSFHKKMREQIPTELVPALAPLLRTLARLHQEIQKYDKLLERRIDRDHPQAKRLMQVDGVGPITALNYVVTVDDPRRFERSRSVASFVGLRPKERSSGKSDPELRISKSGDAMLRRHLVQSAQYMLGPFGKQSDLRTWGLKLASRGGKSAKKRAVVAVARKLSVLLHRLWMTGAPYDPLRNRARRPPPKTALA